MITLSRSNSYFFINSDIPIELRDSLDEVLSYYKEGYEKTDAFQSGRWDGREHLLRRASNGSYYFPFGLLDKVCQVFRIWGLKYEIIDNVCPIAPIPDNYGDDESIRLRPYQRDALNKLIVNCYNSSGIIALPTAAGKCHGKGTKILMHDGSIKNVEDVKVGDQLMGPDSKPRNVLSLARGVDEMFLISPIKGDSWTCNKSHVLSLKATQESRGVNRGIINIPLDEYFNQSKTFKHVMKQWRTGIEFEEKETYTDPYIIGLWLGDGSKHDPCITNSDVEIIDAMYKFASDNDLIIREDPGNNTTMHHFSSPIRGLPGKNTFRNAIKECFINGEKRIPREYLINCRSVRLKLLAGLLDTDGYYNHCGYEIITKYDGLKDDILFLARSLGLAAYSSVKIGRIKSTGFEGKYHRVTINGITDIIPCRVGRKKALKRKMKKDVLKTGFKVIPQGIGEYYGFQLDGDSLYLLGDFTVTHNTSCALFYARYIGLPFMVLVHRVELLRQWRDEIKEKLGIDATLIGAGEDRAGDGRATIAMVQTLAKRDEKYDTGLLIADELHVMAAKTFYPVAMKINAKYRLGLSATPTRADGAELKIFACCGCIASVVSVEDLVKDGYLAVPEFYMVNLPTCRVPYSSTWQTVYKQGIVLNMDRNERISEIARGYLKDGRCVYIHVNRVDHGKILEGMIDESVFVHGATKKDEREQIISDFKDGKIRCLISTLLKEGVSIDGISCLIYASGGKSEVALIQTIGRSLRVDPVFGDAIVVDFRDAGHRMLENHVQERIMAYRKTYGELYPY